MALSPANSTQTSGALSKCCRLCLIKCDELHALFAPSSNGSNLAELVLHLTGITANESDGLRGICALCYNHIYDFMIFRRKSQQTNAQIAKTVGQPPIAPVAKSSEEANNKFTETILRDIPTLTEDQEAFSPSEHDPQNDSNDEDWTPSESDQEQQTTFEEKFKVRKLTKRDLRLPKAYHGLCNICGKEYKHLWRHLESHNAVTVDRCKVCAKEFKSKTGLMLHELMHQEAEHKCDRCNKKYRTKNRLKRHYRVHTNDRPFDCDKCDKKFYTKYNLEVHSRIHTGIRPYACQYCGLQFTHSYAVKNHMVRFHLEILALK
ncbi:zinc finger protein 232-like [Culex pipiens pallens]|uniref:zinc finger protein 232-like n=1 Tax=Culex pipiens pallens TaxID=42434 RepID=UPI001953CDF7|nr:zinc finger protein 232-like [Culex pipiens pallens]